MKLDFKQPHAWPVARPQTRRPLALGRRARTRARCRPLDQRGAKL